MFQRDHATSNNSADRVMVTSGKLSRSVAYDVMHDFKNYCFTEGMSSATDGDFKKKEGIWKGFDFRL